MLKGFSLKSKYIKPDKSGAAYGKCSISIQKQNGKIQISYDGVNAFGATMTKGVLELDSVKGSVFIPQEHYLAPLRKVPFTNFRFPNVEVVSGEVKAKDLSVRVNISVNRDISIFKGGVNKPWIASFNGEKSQNISLRFSKDGNYFHSISIYLSDPLSTVLCESEIGIPLSRVLNFNDLLLTDFPE